MNYILILLLLCSILTSGESLPSTPIDGQRYLVGNQLFVYIDAQKTFYKVTGDFNMATNTIQADITVDGNITVNGLTASQYVKTDANKKLSTVSSIPSTDISGLNTIVASLRANRNISGGGTVSVDSSTGNVKWTNRFIVIANGTGSFFGTSGHFDINCPPSGTTITGVGGASNVTVTSAGIPLTNWQALYYILPIGSGNPTVNANFRVVMYTGALEIPHDWVLICVKNGDNATTYFNNGIALKQGESFDTTKPLFKSVGTQVTNKAVGWYTIAVNNGSRATGKFVVTDMASSAHQTVVFNASHHYGSGNNITVLHQSAFSNTPIQYIRIKYGGTYDGAMLQIYVDNATNALQVNLTDNDQSSGWVLKDWIADGTDPGGLGTYSSCTNTTASVDLDVGGAGKNLIANYDGENFIQIKGNGTITASGGGTNSDNYGVNISLSSKVNTNSTKYSFGLYSIPYTQIDSGVTNSGYNCGILTNVLRNYNIAGDAGTLTSLYGGLIQYGHYNTDDFLIPSAPTTTTVHGLYLQPYTYTGSMTTIYDIYVADYAGSGSTVTNRWGLYIAGSNKNNAIGGSLTVGAVTAPTATLDVGGTVKTSGRIFSGAPGTGGIWVDGSNQFIGSYDASNVGIYANGAWRWSFNNNGVFTSQDVVVSNLTPSQYVKTDANDKLVTVSAATLAGELNHNNLANKDVAGNHAKLIPSANSTSAIQITKADGTTAILNVDTTNNRVGVGTTSPSDPLHVVGNARATNAVLTPAVRPIADGTNAISIQDTVGNNFVRFDSTNRRVGIGAVSTAPNSTLVVDAGTNSVNTARFIGQTGAAHTNFESYTDNGVGVIFEVIKGKGTLATPTKTDDNGAIFEMRFAGYDAQTTAGKRYVGMIKCDVDGTVTSSAIPGKITFRTNNTTGNTIDAIGIDSKQRFAIYSTSTTDKDTATTYQMTGKVANAAGTATVLFNGNADDLIIATNTAWLFEANVIMYDTATAVNARGCTVRGVVMRSTGNISIVGTPTYTYEGSTTWTPTVAATANTTTQSLKFNITSPSAFRAGVTLKLTEIK
jgi:hypothetical protein